MRCPRPSVCFAIAACCIAVCGGCAAGDKGSGGGSGGGAALDVSRFGARGDGRTNDAPAIQRAVDAAAKAGGGVVALGDKKTYWSGTIRLPSNVTLRVEKGATLLASDRREDYEKDSVLIGAEKADDVVLTGGGVIDGGAKRFMVAERPNIDKAGPWRPTVLQWVDCRRPIIRGVTFKESPFWCVHLAGCEAAVIEDITILNNMRVPNCDGIDIDHCRDVIVRRCRIEAGDDCVCLKNTREFSGRGDCSNIRVSDCSLVSNSCAIKIGTETVDDVSDVIFERCQVRQSNRGLGIMLRDSGNVRDITFRDISVETRLAGDPWWGKAEPIYISVRPRTEGSKVGVIENITISDVRARGEGGVYVGGCDQSRPRGIVMKNVSVLIERTTDHPGGILDLRPGVGESETPHRTNGFFLDTVGKVTLKDCSVAWGEKRPDWFGAALEVRGGAGEVALDHFSGEPARAGGPAQIRD